MTFGWSPGTGPPPNLDQILAAACQQAGIPARRRRLLRHFANAVYLVEDVPVVARVAYGSGAIERSRTAVTIARWLVTQGFPATEPASIVADDQPFVVAAADEVAVTFWRYYPQPPDAHQHDLGVLGEITRGLHSLGVAPPTPLRTYQPLRSIGRAAEDAIAAGVIDKASLQWLGRHIDYLRDQYGDLEFPLGVGLIHADMYAGNLLWSVGTPPAILGDWDTVCVGPREIDLAPTFTATRFGLSAKSLDRFVRAYGYDLRDWSGYPTLRAIREVSTLTALVRLAPVEPASAYELRHRLTTLQRGDSETIWTRQ